jgi:hypothetical protein
VDDHLAIRARREAVAARLQVPPQVAVVVDLAVDDRRAPAVLREEGLVAACHIDDREPGVREQRRPAAVHPLAVRPAMPQRGDHPPAACV